MTLRVAFHPAARGDLFGLYDYIAEHSGITRAGAYLDRIETACSGLGAFPEQGRRRDDIAPGVRTFGFERRVLIVYRIIESELQILRILYAGRELPSGPPSDQQDW